MQCSHAGLSAVGQCKVDSLQRMSGCSPRDAGRLANMFAIPPAEPHLTCAILPVCLSFSESAIRAAPWLAHDSDRVLRNAVRVRGLAG